MDYFVFYQVRRRFIVSIHSWQAPHDLRPVLNTHAQLLDTKSEVRSHRCICVAECSTGEEWVCRGCKSWTCDGDGNDEDEDDKELLGSCVSNVSVAIYEEATRSGDSKVRHSVGAMSSTFLIRRSLATCVSVACCRLSSSKASDMTLQSMAVIRTPA